MINKFLNERDFRACQEDPALLIFLEYMPSGSIKGAAPAEFCALDLGTVSIGALNFCPQALRLELAFAASLVPEKAPAIVVARK